MTSINSNHNEDPHFMTLLSAHNGGTDGMTFRRLGERKNSSSVVVTSENIANIEEDKD